MKKRRLLNRKIHNVPAVMALGIMVLAAAQARAASGKLDLSTPQAAVEAFNSAFRTGDIITARAATVSDPRSVRLTEALLNYGTHLRHLLTNSSAPLEFVRIADATFTIDGTQALILESGKPIMAAHHIDTHWKLDLAATLPHDSTDTAAQTIAQLTRIIRRAASGTDQ